MRLFHVSEESNIKKFLPRAPDRNDLDQSKGLVWALAEACLPNYLTPRNCPRIAYYATEKTTHEDVERFFSSSSRHCVVIEYDWYKTMTQTTLYLYEINPSNFYLQDSCAGYYVSECIERPTQRIRIEDLFEELFKRNTEVRMVNSLWALGDAVKESTLNWSLCRMRNAKPR